mmetsp:Transcript_1945/g.3108  ORF Transcript_1945/g.3108 Transcript_1945/m.3108 type:complete len:101 (+) Transcript_1945:486-788(+)
MNLQDTPCCQSLARLIEKPACNLLHTPPNHHTSAMIDCINCVCSKSQVQHTDRVDRRLHSAPIDSSLVPFALVQQPLHSAKNIQTAVGFLMFLHEESFFL